MESGMIAFCGLACDTCPIHLATLEVDLSRQKEMRESITKIFSTQYMINILPGDIGDCDGCRGENNRLFFGCGECKVRACAKRKGIKNCAFCEEFACDNLKDLFKYDPHSKTRLEKIKSSILPDV